VKTPEILFEDHHLVAVNKPRAMPSQPDPTGDQSVLKLLRKRFRRTYHIVNRIDRPTSGIVLLAKTGKAAAAMSRLIQERKMVKTYLAAVGELPDPPSGIRRDYLIKRNNKAEVTDDPGKGKEAILKYRLAGESDRYFFLEIEPITGRFHQIRAQLAHFGYPIKGDVKYGARRSNPDRSIHLHAWKLSFRHPFTGEQIELIAPLPDDPIWNSI
jgi:23S rRNA pseudouridine1911/1915/1917 synthase